MKKILLAVPFLLIVNFAFASTTELLAKIAESVKTARAIKTPMNAAHVDFLKAPKYAEGISHLGDSAKVESAVADLGDQLHGTWQVNFRKAEAEKRAKDSTYVPKTDRFKPMKLDGKPITTEAELQKYFEKNNIPAEYRKKMFRFQDDGKGNMVAHEDILNMPNRYLAPNNQGENTASAYAAVMFADKWLAAGGKIDAAFMRAASSFVHDQWMARAIAGGYPKPTEAPDLFKPFDQLSAVEAKKDTDIVNDALRTYYTKLTAADVNKLQKVGNVLKGADSAGAAK